MSQSSRIVENGTFEGEFGPVGPTGQARISGEVPSAWGDNSAWNDVIGRYSKIGDAATGDLVVSGQQALRMEHKGSQAERFTMLQLRQSIHLEKDKVYRLAAAMRSPFGPLAGGHRQGFALSIREQESPYTTFGALAESLEVDWREYETRFTVPESGEYVILAQLHNAGVVDLDAVVVEAAEVAEFEGPFVEGNFLPNGRFPVGVGGPFTWSFDWQVDRAARVEGPLGESALYLPERFVFRTPPVAVNPGRPYTFSVYLKSDTPNLPVRMFYSTTARTGGEFLAGTTWPVGTSWERYSFTVMMPPVRHGVVYVNLRSFNAKGIAMDGLRLEEGEALRDYNEEGRAEVIIGLPPATGNQGIYLEGEPVVLTLGVTGQWAPGARVHLTLTDVFGEQAKLPGVVLPAGEVLHRCEVEIAPDAIDPSRALGSFRLAAQVVDADSVPLGPISEMTFMRVPEPLNPDVLQKDSPAGIHVRINEFGLQMAQKMGFKWVRNHDMVPGAAISKWSYVEPEQGEFQWQDAMLDQITDHGLLLLALVDTSPDWANKRPEGYGPEEDDFRRRNYVPRDLEEYATFLTTLAVRYAGLIHAYEVWNEPYSSTFFRDYKDGRTVHASPEDLAAVHEAAYRALKAVDPEITVVGVCSGSGLTAYIQRAFEAGIYPNYDVLAFHQYSHYRDSFPEVGNPGLLVAEEATYGGGDSPIWNTEGSPMPRVSFFHEVNPIPEATKSEWSIDGGHLELAAMYPRFMLSNLAHGAEKVFFYSFEIRPVMVEERGFKLLEPTGVPIPGMGAVASLNKRLNTGATLVAVQEPAENVIALIFEGGGTTFAALLSRDGNPVDWTPAASLDEATILDLFGNAIEQLPRIQAAPVYIVYDDERGELLKGIFAPYCSG